MRAVGSIHTTTWCSAATTLGLVTVIDTAAPMRGRAMLTHGEVIAALVANRLCGPPHAALTAADVLSTYQDQWIIEQRHRDPKQTLPVRPVFLHNDDRIQALIAVVGIALLVFGLIEAELRRALGPGTPLPGILPEHRDAVPTARAVLTAFAGQHATYTTTGLLLDRLTPTQRLILAHLDIPYHGPKHTALQQIRSA
jgi:hypothetical protein